MAAFFAGRSAAARSARPLVFRRPQITSIRHQRRCLQSHSNTGGKPVDFAFAFDIDGVLLRSAKPLPRAPQALKYLQRHQIPFILLTNGGGKGEQERVDELSQRLDVPLDTKMFIQSHTPFAEFVHNAGPEQQSLKDKCVLVLGGDRDKCRQVAENYGFTNVLTSADMITAFPTLMPFACAHNYTSFARPLSPNATLAPHDPTSASASSSSLATALKVDVILVFNDPRDWVLDTQLIIDLLLSHQGYLGSVSPLNDNASLPNRGYQQDGQPRLYFSNPDLLWAAEYHLPRLGQGAFKEALGGVWAAVTGGASNGVELKATMFGKPHQGTYEFAEKRLQAMHHHSRRRGTTASPESAASTATVDDDNNNNVTTALKKVYMIGDNPESDILGANSYISPFSTHWTSILVRTGVYSGAQQPRHQPKVIVDDVADAIAWALEKEKEGGWDGDGDGDVGGFKG